MTYQLCRKSKRINKKTPPGTNKQLYSKVARKKINRQKKITLLYTNNEQVGFEFKNNIIHSSTQKIKDKYKFNKICNKSV